jgi:biopolymer transport protein ExbD
MAIYAPGKKFRNHRLLSRIGGKREMVAQLSLTAMVDMFTVLVIFLLQNYSATGEVIFIPKGVELPKAEKTKDLKPAVVVTISNKEILMDKTVVISFDVVKAQEDWMIAPLKAQVEQGIKDAKAKFDAKIANQLRGVVDNGKNQIDPADTPWNKITVQADKGIDFLTVKKVLYTVTEAGGGEINFAVNKSASTK